MSLINEVLNELERRGANAPLGEATIRPVPPRRQSKLLPYGLAALGITVLLAAASWYLRHEERQTEQVAAVAVPVSAVSDVAMTAAVSGVPSDLAEIGPPASKLSFELSSITPFPGGSERTAQTSGGNEAGVPLKNAPALPERGGSKDAIKAEPRQGGGREISPLKQISPQQHVENEFRQANQAVQQGKADEAIAGYERVIKLDPMHHQARKALVGALIGAGRHADAEKALQAGLKRDSHETSFAMLLARLQVERDAVGDALETLQKSLPYAEGQADYHAFVAALLQREKRHKEAVMHFQVALQLAPDNGVWLMGMGISLQAIERNEDARQVYRRALDSNSLNPQLQAYVEKKLKEL
ncbi:MAG TPA: tetratricopeptide repeat protein [Sideroxyarcus sp.]|nr:tetratricopeptide repeat protein [Sideroxyarcus sp.]